MSPKVSGIAPISACTRVVLPAPEAPIRETHEPPSIWRFRLSRTAREPKILVAFLNSITETSIIVL